MSGAVRATASRNRKATYKFQLALGLPLHGDLGMCRDAALPQSDFKLLPKGDPAVKNLKYSVQPGEFKDNPDGA